MSSIILKKVNHIRSKPAHHRHIWTLGLSVGFTSVIAIVWALNLSLGLYGNTNLAKQERQAKPSPFSQVAGVATTNIDIIKNGIVTVFSDLVSLLND